MYEKKLKIIINLKKKKFISEKNKKTIKKNYSKIIEKIDIDLCKNKETGEVNPNFIYD